MVRDLYETDDRTAAAAALGDWHRWAQNYDVTEMNRLAKTLRAWEPELLAFFDTRLTNGRTEGRNLIVKHVKRQGFGYRNPRHYRLRVLYRCG
jgi:transposase